MIVLACTFDCTAGLFSTVYDWLFAVTCQGSASHIARKPNEVDNRIRLRNSETNKSYVNRANK